jgi:membrane protein implicated in regulation of membrane protease activity
VAVVCAFVGISLNTQLILFMVSSVALFVTLRRWFKTIFTGEAGLSRKEDEDRNFTGVRVQVVEPIVPPGFGKVELNGTLWNAGAEQTLASGDLAEVVSRHNLVLTVRKI